jgi:hypothetical protein
MTLCALGVWPRIKRGVLAYKCVGINERKSEEIVQFEIIEHPEWFVLRNS